MKKYCFPIILAFVFANASAELNRQDCEKLLGAGIYNGYLEQVCKFQGGVQKRLNQMYSDGGCRGIVPQSTIDTMLSDVLEDSQKRYKAVGHKAFCGGNKKSYYQLSNRSPQSSKLPKFKRGELYAGIRTKMMKSGWRPYTSPDADTCSQDDRRCQGRPEMVSCSGTGLANCLFLWKKNDKIISISTYGEEKPMFNGVGTYP